MKKSTFYHLLALLMMVGANHIIAQIPLSQIEGRLEVYLPEDECSTHIGRNAGRNQDLSVERFNTFVGSAAGTTNTVGQINSFFGSSSGKSNTSGDSNSFFGFNSGSDNTTGEGNSFFGSSSGSDNTTGILNSFFGSFSGASNITGNQNLYLGHFTAMSVEGSGNIFIGYSAGPNDRFDPLETINNRLYIHNDHTPNPLIYGEFDNSLLKVNGELHVENTVHINEVMKLEPQTNIPTCMTSMDEGLLYYSATLHKVRACVYDEDTDRYIWMSLH